MATNYRLDLSGYHTFPPLSLLWAAWPYIPTVERESPGTDRLDFEVKISDSLKEKGLIRSHRIILSRRRGRHSYGVDFRPEL